MVSSGQNNLHLEHSWRENDPSMHLFLSFVGAVAGSPETAVDKFEREYGEQHPEFNEGT